MATLWHSYVTAPKKIAHLGNNNKNSKNGNDNRPVLHLNATIVVELDKPNLKTDNQQQKIDFVNNSYFSFVSQMVPGKHLIVDIRHAFPCWGEGGY